MRRTLHRAAAAALTAALALGGVVAVGIAPATAAPLSFSGQVGPTDPQVGNVCETQALSHSSTQQFSVSAPGVYTATMTAMSSGDLMYSLMAGSSSCLAFNDDTNDLRPAVEATLQPGVLYRLIVTNYLAGSTATTTWTTAMDGPGTIVLGAGPAVTIAQAAGQLDPSTSSPVRFQVDFSEPVSGFDASDVILSGPTGSTAIVAGGPSSYVVEVSGMQSSGRVGIAVAVGAASSSATGLATLTPTVVDASVVYAPPSAVTVQQSSGQADAASTLPVSFDVRFAEAVTGFVAGDVLVSGTAGGGAVTVTGSGTSYVVSVAGAQRPGSIEVAIPANVAQTAFGGGTLEATSTDRSVTFLPNAPVATIAPIATTTASLPARFSVEFDGPVEGFDAQDVLLGGTAAPAGVTVSGSGASYAVDVTDAAAAGTITAQVRAIAASRFSLTNAASGVATATFAPPRPTVTIEQAPTQDDPTTTPVADFAIELSEEVTGLSASDFVVGGTAGATEVTLEGSGSSYVATVAGVVRPGTITLALPEGAATSRFQETSLAATSVDGSVDFQPLAPTVVATVPDGQASPTTSSTVTFQLAFSEPVIGLGVEDLVVDGEVGGRASVLSEDGGLTYTVTFTNLERAGDLTISLRAGAVENAYGVANAASNDVTVTFAPVRPTVTVEQSPAQADAAEVDGFVFDVVLSMPVSDLEESDLVIGGTAGATTVELVGDGTSYVATVRGAVRPGTVTLSLPEGAATGAFETASLASTSVDAEVTFAPPAPTATVEQGAEQEDPTSLGFVVFDVTFSHDVTGLDAADLVVGGTAGATSASLEGSGSSYRVSVFDMTSPGTVTVALGAGAAVDRYGLESLAATSADASVEFAPSAPTATITRDAAQPAVTSTQPFVFDVEFSAPVSGLDVDDVIVVGDTGASVVEVSAAGTPQSSGDAATALDVVAADELLYDWTVRVSGATSYGTVSIAIREDAVLSGYGVANEAIEASVDGTVLYAPAVVAPTPVAPAPVAPAPAAPAPIAPAPAAVHGSLPQTGADVSWLLLAAAMLLLAAGAGARRAARR
ncbi:hypothetical protein GCM10009846_17270 [Agrococcus versicolor]|uniref:Gram-positive cocci surface proteins LPxTG domain-containing protein n=1 Tax=Agrococcus versicolor TaxID=501482 RepID=A0ABP5MI43_9MICO